MTLIKHLGGRGFFKVLKGATIKRRQLLKSLETGDFVYDRLSKVKANVCDITGLANKTGLFTEIKKISLYHSFIYFFYDYVHYGMTIRGDPPSFNQSAFAFTCMAQTDKKFS